MLNIAFAAREGKKKAINMSNVQVEPRARESGSWAVAVDGGTTNTRARLVHEGRVVATARRAIGVRDVVVNEGREVEARVVKGTAVHADDLRQGLRTAVAGAIAEVSAAVADSEGGQTGLVRPVLIAAAGMLTSEMGLVTVPHVLAPAGLEDLAAQVVVLSIPEIADVPIAFVPGLKTPAHEGPDGWMWADVMRGEECETLGALYWLERQGSLRVGETEHVFVWPGSHTKLVEVDRLGRITRSHTSLAGELLAAVARQTLIAASLPPELPDQLDFEATEAGARAALGHGLGRAAFLVRIAALTETLNAEERGVLDWGRADGRCSPDVIPPDPRRQCAARMGGWARTAASAVCTLAGAISLRSCHSPGRRARRGGLRTGGPGDLSPQSRMFAARPLKRC